MRAWSHRVLGYLSSGLCQAPVVARLAAAVGAGGLCIPHDSRPYPFDGGLRIRNRYPASAGRAYPSVSFLRHAPRPCAPSGPSRWQIRSTFARYKGAACMDGDPSQSVFPGIRVSRGPNRSQFKLYQHLEVLEAEKRLVIIGHPPRVLTIYVESRFVCIRSILHALPACGRKTRRCRKRIRDKTRTLDELPC